jgi:hypothetical protein
LRARAEGALLAASVSRLKVKRFVVAATRGLAGVLAGALVLLELLAADGGFHQALLHGGKSAPANCVLCLLAKGQVDLPQSAPAVASPLRPSFAPAPKTEFIAAADFLYLASPSRAPPSARSCTMVVG